MDYDDWLKIENILQGLLVFSFGVSIDINWDDCDFVFNLCWGQYVNFCYIYYVFGLGSDICFEEFQLYYSYYYVLSEKSVFVWEVDGVFIQGEVLWSMMLLFGSDEWMCGYYQGCYWDKKVVSGQLEYCWQFIWWYGIVVWVGVGIMGFLLLLLNNGCWLFLVGVGYCFEFKFCVNVCFDYGIGNGSSGFYFQVGEVF